MCNHTLQVCSSENESIIARKHPPRRASVRSSYFQSKKASLVTHCRYPKGFLLHDLPCDSVFQKSWCTNNAVLCTASGTSTQVRGLEPSATRFVPDSPYAIDSEHQDPLWNLWGSRVSRTNRHQAVRQDGSPYVTSPHPFLSDDTWWAWPCQQTRSDLLPFLPLGLQIRPFPAKPSIKGAFNFGFSLTSLQPASPSFIQF
jgi:hypothetical protein